MSLEPITDLLVASLAIMRNVATRRSRGNSLPVDDRAERAAIDGVVLAGEHIEVCAAGWLTSEDIELLTDYRRMLRHHELWCWRTAPQFLRTR